MRKFIFLALMGLLSTMTTGCGIIQQVAYDTCTTSYNKFVCPDRPTNTYGGELKLIRDNKSCEWARARFVVSTIGGKRTAITTFRSKGTCIAERILVQEAAKKAIGLSCQWTTLTAPRVVCR